MCREERFLIVVVSVYMLIIKWKLFELLENSFNSWVEKIENWVITYDSVLPICFGNVTSQVPYPSSVVII